MGRQLGFHILGSHFFSQGIKLFLVMCFWFSFTGAPRCFRFEQHGATSPQASFPIIRVNISRAHFSLSLSFVTFHIFFPRGSRCFRFEQHGSTPCTPQFHVFESTFPVLAFFKSHCLFPNEEVFWGGAAWVYSPASLQAAEAAMA